MKPEEQLKEIEDKWTHSRMDYTDSKWLINRIKRLTEALEWYAAGNGWNHDDIETASNLEGDDIIETAGLRARKALEEKE